MYRVCVQLFCKLNTVMWTQSCTTAFNTLYAFADICISIKWTTFQHCKHFKGSKCRDIAADMLLICLILFPYCRCYKQFHAGTILSRSVLICSLLCKRSQKFAVKGNVSIAPAQNTWLQLYFPAFINYIKTAEYFPKINALISSYLCIRY